MAAGMSGDEQLRVVFVHGTGVRREGFTRLSDLVLDRLRSRLPPAEVSAVYWGDMHGASLAADGGSIPRRGRVRGPSEATPPDEEAAAWGLLLVDPLCELRVLGELVAQGEGSGSPGALADGRRLARALEGLSGTLAIDTATSNALAPMGGTKHIVAAAEVVAGAAEFTDACDSVADALAVRDLATATARAVVAHALAAAADDVICTGDERDAVVDLLTTCFNGTARFPGERVAAVLGTLALRVTTQPVLDRFRTSLTTGAVPPLGDILRYQARGGPLRDHLEQVMKAEGQTVVVGHSLGGIALVDVCALAAIGQSCSPQPLLLVTVGSQAPFLHELGALTGLPPTASLPPGFPRWLNIYDRKDLLAYRAEPVFPGDGRVIDHEVSSRQPFPLSHSAYWKLDAVYDRIVKEIEASR
ncbi:hypothetical protein ACFVGX_02785 [Streptomyces sp. NPDC127113]|uniref:hypothetical protein n=1 Tax=Streptomyces sp. NPDC127113 TaxID=3345365 RepID=UPI003626ECE9